ncbi:MAG TPA: helix-turn-helix domain-containing protein [Candidatus Limnocylindria bacterium]
MEAAVHLFARNGIDGTSVDDIARAVSLSRATVFNHFPYKEALLVEIGARLVADIAREASAHRRRSVRRRLYDLADGIATIAEHYPSVVPHIAREMTHPDPERRAHAAARMQYPALYEGLLENLEAAGQLRSRGRQGSYGRQLVDMTTGALVRVGNDFGLDELRTELRANVDVFLEGAVTDLDRE